MEDGGEDFYASPSSSMGGSRRSLPTPAPSVQSHDGVHIDHGQTAFRDFSIPVGETLHGNAKSGHDQLEPCDVDWTSFSNRMAMVKRVLGDSLPQAPVKTKLAPKVRSSYQSVRIAREDGGMPYCQKAR